MQLPGRDKRATEVLRESWPGAFRVQEPVDDLRREALLAADELVAGGRGRIDRLFAIIESEPPTLKWDPDVADLGAGELAFLLRFWLERRQEGGPPPSRMIDALDLKPALGCIMLMEPTADGEDFRYRVYGSRIVEYSKVEMTGKCVWDVPSPYVAAFFLTTYRAVSIRRQPLHAFHRSRLDQYYAQWERLILPFVDDEGTVNRLLVGNVPSVRR